MRLILTGPQSCISEAQKYQGALYRSDKEKRSKPTKTSRCDLHRASDSAPRKAYVEDAPDPDGGVVTIVDAPPHAPSPPTTAASRPPAALPAVNVFDFLVDEDTPNASKTDIAADELVHVAEAVPPDANGRLRHVSRQNASTETFGESRYSQLGFHYGDGPVPIAQHERHVYLTPASQQTHDGVLYRTGDGHGGNSKDRKRKRVQVEELQISKLQQHTAEGDHVMTDAPPVLHSGLTGGLNRLLSRPGDYPPSPDYSSADRGGASPGSPLKRSKRFSATNGVTALVSTRKRSGSAHRADGHRLHKSHRRSHRHRHDEPERPARKIKTIKYRAENELSQTQNQLVVYRSRAELFMSFVNKGPESEKGCSINKALKRYHRERGGNLGKGEEERELWKSLRLRRNERGEIVLFC